MIVGNGDFINLSGDESKALMFQNMLSESTVSDAYKLANVPEGTYISGVEFDESTNTFTFTFSNGTEFTAKVNSSGEVDLSEYVKKDEVDSRIESIIGSAPEALDTLQELSKALGDDPNFATTVTEMISEVEKKTEEIKSSIPSIDGLATKEEVKEVQDSIPNLDEYVTNEQLESKGYLTEHQDISNLATKDELTEATKDSVKYKEFTYTNAESETFTRKTIQLDNYDTISGITTSGVGVNLAMVSKWDVADFGSTSVHMNLNSKDGKVTINDDEEIAVKSDIPSIDGLAQTSYVVLQKDQAIETSKEYTDSKAEEVKGMIPSVEGLASEDWVESKGYLTEHQDISGLATKEELQSEATIARAAEKANSDAILLKADKTEVALKANQSDVDFQVNAINEVTSKLRTDVDYCGQRIDEDLENTSTALASKVSWDESKSKIVLPSGGQLVGTKYGADGSDPEDGAVIAQLNKWDVMDFGSTKYPLNLNVPSGVRPTVQEQGQSGEEANKVAYLSDLDTVVRHQDDSLGKKVIVLSNDEQILSSPNDEELEHKVEIDEGSVPLIKLNKWNVVDVGSPKTIVNINTPKGVRPTVQEKGQSGLDANEIAYLSDLSSISSLQSMVQVLEEKVNSLSKINTEIVVISEDSEDLIDDTKDYNISGSVSSTLNITGSSITINNLEVSNDARLKLIAKDVDSKGMSISGSFPKTNGNTVVSVNNSDYVIFRDLVFNATEVYNGIEIGLNSTNLPKNVIFDNCKFLGNFSNNAILIFGTQNNSVINISNCYFEHVSNCIRLSNKSNSTCTVNITNCKCDHWDTDPLWSGMLICQDYTSGSAEDEVTNNLFSSSKITINVSNFTTPSGKKLTAPDDMSTICGSSDENQVFYVWSNYSNTTPYGDGSRYPTINIL